MSEGRLTIGNRRYSSWSMRGWLLVQLAGLDVEVRVIPLTGGTPEVLALPSRLVPFLEHRGLQVWESLAIAEYCEELMPGMWPADFAARTRARVISAEMHAGFRALRTTMPMVLGADGSRAPRTAEALADVARVEALWRDTRAALGAGGPFLFGAAFNAADAMFAPVVTRLLTYAPPVGPETRAYCEAVRAHPLVAEWYDAAAREPETWRQARYEPAAMTSS